MLAELTEEVIRTKGAQGGKRGMKRKFEGGHLVKSLGRASKETEGLVRVDSRPGWWKQRNIINNHGVKSAELKDT
jgi:hypothetical protein